MAQYFCRPEYFPHFVACEAHPPNHHFAYCYFAYRYYLDTSVVAEEYDAGA